MKHFLRFLGLAALGFAIAAAPPLQPAAIDLLAMTPDTMPTSPAFPTLHQKTLVVTDGMTAALSIGGAPKHYHAQSNEIQLILDGSGTEWLGDRQVPLRAGMLIVIPVDTAHAGIVDTSGGKLRLVAFKTPPQPPTDIHLLNGAEVAPANTTALQPAAVDLLAITPDAMPSPSATFPNLRNKTLVVTDGMTLALQTGTAPKHYHANANEIQVVLDGTGTEWLGDQQVNLRPGMMIVIPMGTNHAGLVQTSSAPLRFISIKTPPQAPTDVHFVQ
jgi:mannose-6-phosphate isomerase-like protein (cupin superfamily)